jgi:hypothetical protein
LLAYRNIADMGSYSQALADFLAHRTTIPDIVATQQRGANLDKSDAGQTFCPYAE